MNAPPEPRRVFRSATPPASWAQRRAFSLMELLVVMAIVVILMAISIPAIASARESARRTTCLSSLRSLGSALRQYMDTRNAGILPAVPSYLTAPDRRWRDVFPLVGEFLAAPLPTRDSTTRRWSAAPPYACPSDRIFRMRYGYSYHFHAGAFMTDPEGPIERFDPTQAQIVTRLYEKQQGVFSRGRLFEDLDFRGHRGAPRGQLGTNAVFWDGSAGWAGLGDFDPGSEPHVWREDLYDPPLDGPVAASRE